MEYFEKYGDMMDISKKLDEWYCTAGAWGVDYFRDVSDAYPMLHSMENKDKPMFIQYAEILQAHDESMMNRFSDMLAQKMNRFEKLMAVDRFDMDEKEAEKIQTQLRFLTEEIEVLSHMAKLIIRHMERWFSPEIAKLCRQYVAFTEKTQSEIEFWKGMYFSEAEQLQMIGGMAVRKGDELIETKTKLDRYQTFFIKNAINA